MNMIDRVTRAIWNNPAKCDLRNVSKGPCGDECGCWPRMQEVARAAIEAMREPTETMIEASNREWDGRMSHRSSGAWQAMIDAALDR